MKIECSSPEELQALKDKTLMLRMVALDEMGISPLTNLSAISKRKQQKVEALILNKWETPYSEIKKIFDAIICDDILDPRVCDVEHLPCLDIGTPDLPEDYKQMLKDEEQAKEESV
jgi:hypothetical protein